MNDNPLNLSEALAMAHPSVERASEPIQTTHAASVEKMHSGAETALDRLNHWLLVKASLERTADWPVVEERLPPDHRPPAIHRSRMAALDEVDKHVYRAQHEVVCGVKLSFPEIEWRVRNGIEAERCIQGETPLVKPAEKPPVDEAVVKASIDDLLGPE
jgi:hypothetical protein